MFKIHFGWIEDQGKSSSLLGWPLKTINLEFSLHILILGTLAQLQRIRADLAEEGNLSVHYETFRNITKHFHSGLIGGGSSSDESGSISSLTTSRHLVKDEKKKKKMKLFSGERWLKIAAYFFIKTVVDHYNFGCNPSKVLTPIVRGTTIANALSLRT